MDGVVFYPKDQNIQGAQIEMATSYKSPGIIKDQKSAFTTRI